MSGTLVTVNALGTIIRRSAVLVAPPPGKYPMHRLSGDITYFFPGTSINRFQPGSTLKEIKA